MACPICNGSKMIVEDRDGTKFMVPCQCFLQELHDSEYRRNVEKSRIPQEFLSRDWEAYKELALRELKPANKEPDNVLFYKNKAAFNVIEHYINNPDQFMKTDKNVFWIYGKSPNTGHTTIACLLGKACMQAGKKVRFITMSELRGLLLSVSREESYEDFFQKVRYFDVYILDDFLDTKKVVFATDYLKAALLDFVQVILSENKKIIGTGELSVFDFQSGNEPVQNVLIRSYAEVNIEGSFNAYIKKSHTVY
jgi:hypothetical protein